MTTPHPTPQSNRERIIAAAYRVLAEEGYEATTIKEIARVAGVAPGLIHYYFINKEELLAAVLHAESVQFTRDQQRVPVTLPGQTPVVAALAGVLQGTREHPERYRLRYELFALGLHHPRILHEVQALLAHGQQGIVEVIHRVTNGVMSDHEAKLLAALMVITFDGLALQSIANPDFDLEGTYEVLATMLAAYVAQVT